MQGHHKSAHGPRKPEYVADKPGVFFNSVFSPEIDISLRGEVSRESVFGTDTQFFAKDSEEAYALAKARGIGETVTGAQDGFIDDKGRREPLMLPSDWYAAGNLPQALHAACWMGYIALKSGTVSAVDLLGDGGVIHNLAHLSLPKQDFDSQPVALHHIESNMLRWLREIEAKVPGYTRPVPIDIATAFPDAATR